MLLAYTHSDVVLVNLAKGLLENAGIEVILKNEFSATGMGPAYSVWLEVWVLNDEDIEQAREMLKSLDEEPA